jgi:Family of unknown function (DUF6455)
VDFLEMVAFLGIGVVGLIALGATFLALWRGASDKPVLLYAMLRRQGDDVARVATDSGSRAFAVAVTQCLRCPATERCRAWLDSGEKRGFEAFCGNAGYVSRIRGLTSFARRSRWA